MQGGDVAAKAKIRIHAPANLDPLEIAQAVVGNGLLVKAEPVPRYGKGTFRRYKAMLTSVGRFERAYDKQLDKMVSEMRRYIEETIKVKLAKADTPKPLITPGELYELTQIVEDYHHAFIAGTIGPETLPPGTVERLIDAGILPEDLRHTFVPTASELPPATMDAIEDAYRYGHVLSASRSYKEKKRRHGLTYKQFVSDYAPKIPIGPNEKHALEWAKHSAATEIKGLGNKISDDFSTIAIEADKDLRRRYEGVIRDSTAENIQRQQTWRQLASDLGDKTGDWSRDFKRIAATEKQKAMQEGIVQGLASRYGDPDDIRVAKMPNPDACPHCMRLHKLPTGQLRIFKMSELVENGSNVGRKARDWKATVGPVHPWCGCDIIHVPEGWAFDDTGEMVPESLLRSDWLNWDLRKALPKPTPDAPVLSYGDSRPDKGISVRVGDPTMVDEIQKVLDRTPPEIFDKDVGITFVTTDIPRVQNPLDEHDFAYWSGNEIRISQTLPAERIARVLPHEIGHSLNVYLIRQLGSIAAVKAWHASLDTISKDEGYVSDYAEREPIENAAEVTMLYLYHRQRLMLRWPRQFAFAHKAYRKIWA
jgi:hypothetical protein